MANGNPAGFVPLYDFGAPKIISGYSREVISGGEIVFASGAADVVSSGANSFVPKTDVLWAQGASGNQVTGIATQTVGSNAPLGVMIGGVAILKVNGTTTAGATQACDGNNCVQDKTTAGHVLGVALTSATSGGFAAVHINR